MRRNMTWPAATALLMVMFWKLSIANANDTPVENAAPAVHSAAEQSKGAADAGVQPANFAAPATAIDSPPVETAPEEVTDAIRIARAERSLQSDRQRLDELKRQLESPHNEFQRAEAAFRELDDRYSAARKQLQDWEAAGDPRAARAAQDLQFLQERWALARSRFDLAIDERKLIQKKIATLQEKIARDQQALDKVVGVVDAEPSLRDGSASPPTTSGEASASSEESSTGPATEPAKSPTESAVAPAEPAAPAKLPALNPFAPGVPLPTVPAANGKENPKATDEANKVDTSPAEKSDKPPSPAIVAAENDAQRKEEAAAEAQEKAQSTTERLELLRESISVEEQLVDKARLKAEQAEAETQTLTRELKQQLLEDPKQAPDLLAKISEAQLRMAMARAELRKTQERLDSQHGELHEAQADHIAALQEAEQKLRESQTAAELVTHLKNPLAWQNIVQWTLERAPKICLIIAGTILFNYLVKVLSRRIVRFVMYAGERGSHTDRQNRADTLAGVFRNAASLAILAGGALMVLDTMGVPVVPLLGGAAIFGLAVAFGAQNLIRDYFSGFMVLMEDQYGVSDVVRIGNISGQVEEITLRMTRLRDIEGIVHFIPHGSITTVSNMSHGWSRALFDVSVAYREDVDAVMAVLMRLAEDLMQDPVFGSMIIEGPQMLGLDNFGDSAVVIRFHLKTKPLMQWPVKRELNRRIKKRFDELGIEIPFPHQTLYFGDGQMPSEAFGGDTRIGRRAG